MRQSPARTLYSFGVDGKQLPLFAAVSRVRRSDDKHEIHGYQRPEVLSHIASIRHYLESGNPMIPNAIVIAFDSRARFEKANKTKSTTDYSNVGTLVVEVDESLDDADKPGWIVDGQQRSAAIREADISEFPICVTAFITDSEAEQRAQFILVNSTKPLPKGLIYELLPTTQEELPLGLQRRRFPARLLERLNYDEDSPLQYLIGTPTNPALKTDRGEYVGVIKDNSILRMIENSLSDGALYRFRDPRTGEGDEERMLLLLKSFWVAVAHVFPEAWALPPRRSRLMHGVGIMSLGFVMDAIADRYRDGEMPPSKYFEQQVRSISEICHWNNGYWDFATDDIRKWNALQNTPRDVQLLTNHLLFAYRRQAGKPHRSAAWRGRAR